MSKKPASLTSDLLARKGEAGPSSADPASRVTLTGGRQPDFSGIGRSEGPSQGLYVSPATERPEMQGMDEEERPRPPEPEIIYTPEDYETGGRTRLIVGAFIGLALLGGVIVAMSLNQGGDVAPLAPEIAGVPPAPAPETAPQAAAAPAAPVAEVPATEAPETEAAAPAAPAPAEEIERAEIEAAPEALVPAAPPAPVASEPAPAAPAAIVPAAPAVASGGAFVVQLAAVREEAAAKSAYEALQKKHPALLGGHALDVERADLGERGIFYRVRAAGFTTRDAAIRTCTSLKSAGQDCMVRAR